MRLVSRSPCIRSTKHSSRNVHTVRTGRRVVREVDETRHQFRSIYPDMAVTNKRLRKALIRQQKVVLREQAYLEYTSDGFAGE